jgi:hypothetical protein
MICEGKGNFLHHLIFKVFPLKEKKYHWIHLSLLGKLCSEEVRIKVRISVSSKLNFPSSDCWWALGILITKGNSQGVTLGFPESEFWFNQVSLYELQIDSHSGRERQEKNNSASVVSTCFFPTYLSKHTHNLFFPSLGSLLTAFCPLNLFNYYSMPFIKNLHLKPLFPPSLICTLFIFLKDEEGGHLVY